MGLFDRLVSALGLRKRECNVLVVGLDNSGKSTVLNHFKPQEQKHAEIVPTVGFNVERFKSRRFTSSSESTHCDCGMLEKREHQHFPFCSFFLLSHCPFLEEYSSLVVGRERT